MHVSRVQKLARNAAGQPLTPLCGSCAPQNISDFDASLSGIAYVPQALPVMVNALNPIPLHHSQPACS